MPTNIIVTDHCVRRGTADVTSALYRDFDEQENRLPPYNQHKTIKWGTAWKPMVHTEITNDLFRGTGLEPVRQLEAPTIRGDVHARQITPPMVKPFEECATMEQVNPKKFPKKWIQHADDGIFPIKNRGGTGGLDINQCFVAKVHGRGEVRIIRVTPNPDEQRALQGTWWALEGGVKFNNVSTDGIDTDSYATKGTITGELEEELILDPAWYPPLGAATEFHYTTRYLRENVYVVVGTGDSYRSANGKDYQKSNTLQIFLPYGTDKVYLY